MVVPSSTDPFFAAPFDSSSPPSAAGAERECDNRREGDDATM
jgi:hypothetical protein